MVNVFLEGRILWAFHTDNCFKVCLKNKIVFIASIKRWRLYNHLDLLFGLSVLCLFVSYITGKRMSGFEYQNIQESLNMVQLTIWSILRMLRFFLFSQTISRSPNWTRWRYAISERFLFQGNSNIENWRAKCSRCRYRGHRRFSLCQPLVSPVSKSWCHVNT